MKIIETKPYTKDAIHLMEELSKTLESITGDSGKNSFDPKDVCIPRSLFVIAYDDEDNAIGCGAIRPMSDTIAEVKRMFVMTKGKGIGSEILKHLENRAKQFDYSSLCLETRTINKKAVLFYQNNGYHQIANYGKYVNRPESICFEKNLPSKVHD